MHVKANITSIVNLQDMKEDIAVVFHEFTFLGT